MEVIAVGEGGLRRRVKEGRLVMREGFSDYWREGDEGGEREGRKFVSEMRGCCVGLGVFEFIYMGYDFFNF